MFHQFNGFSHPFSQGGSGFYGGYIMMGFGLIFVVVLIYLAMRTGRVGHSDSGDTPLDLLQKRFVNGEISQEEFLEKREILKK